MNMASFTNVLDKVSNLKIVPEKPNFNPNGITRLRRPHGSPPGPSNVRAAPSEPQVEDEPEKQFSAAETSLLQKVLRKGLVKTTNSVDVQENNSVLPQLYSVKSFAALNLKPELLNGVYALGFNVPSKIQETALPILLSEPPRNLIAQSQSGTGKTAAFLLAVLSRVDTSKSYPQIICLSPTYELAVQTGEVAAKMGRYLPGIKMRFALKGENLPRNTKLEDHILIGTPGKIMDWGLKFKFFDLSKISVFVLDEADVMIAVQGHQDMCIRIHNKLSPHCQNMLFSATYDPEVMNFAEIIIPNPITIKVKREDETLDNIRQYYVKCQGKEEKYRAITNIYGVITIGQAIIFCHTKKTANWLSEEMTKDGHTVAILSSDLEVDERIKVLDRFREGFEKVLITTNVLARGIDVEQVTIVINFDLPMDLNGKADCETYLHRIGRTGRFGKPGIAINLIDGHYAMQICQDIQAHFMKQIYPLNIEDPDEIERIGF